MNCGLAKAGDARRCEWHLFSGGETIDASTFSLSASGQLVRVARGVTSGESSNATAVSWLKSGQTLEQIETTVLDAAVELCDGNVSAAAKLLGMGRGQLQYRLLKRRPAERPVVE